MRITIVTGKTVITAFWLWCLLLASACRAETTIEIGATFPLTGPLALYGNGFKNGVLLAEKEINAAAGITDPGVKVSVNDNQGVPKIAVSDVRHFIDIDKFPVVMDAFDFLTVPVLPITDSNKVVMVSHTILKFTEKSRPRYAFRSYWDSEGVGRQLGDAAKTRKIEKIAAIALEDTAFPFFREGFVSGLGKNFIVEERFSHDQNDFASLLLRIRAAQPDAILVYGFPEHVANVLKRMSALGMDTTPLFIAEGAEDIVENGNQQILQKTKAISYLGSRPAERYGDFIERYKKAYGEMPRLDALLSYDAAKLLYEAVRKCGAADRDCIAAAVGVDFDENHNRVYQIPLIQYDNGWRIISD